MHDVFNELCRQAASRGFSVGVRSTNRATNALKHPAALSIDAVQVFDSKRKVKAFRATTFASLDANSEHLIRELGWRKEQAA